MAGYAICNALITKCAIENNCIALLCHSTVQNLTTFRVQKNVFPADEGSTGFPVPFDLPPQRYSSKGEWNRLKAAI